MPPSSRCLSSTYETVFVAPHGSENDSENTSLRVSIEAQHAEMKLRNGPLAVGSISSPTHTDRLKGGREDETDPQFWIC